MGKDKTSWILYMATFPPRECGIATFAKDLATAMDRKFSPAVKSKILAMNKDGISIYNYPEDVTFEMNDNDMDEYIETAKKINDIDNIRLINIQHEFGIFGGKYGDYLLAFLEVINKPVIITLHSLLPAPEERLKKVIQSIAKKVICIIVMTQTAVEILRKDYEVKTDIVVVPHGIPSVPFDQSTKEKIKLGYENKTVLSSFGMISSGKGYEYVIDALPDVIKKFPSVLYLIVGETHPVVRKNEGENYRNFLEKKVEKLKLQKNVKFYNKYLTLSEIIRYLQATDIYLSTSKDPYQITSGTLVYAMGCGRAVISTPFLHAKDIINGERGLLVEFNNPRSFSDAIMRILSDQELKSNMEKNAYSYTRHMTWPNVALAYMDVFNKYVGIARKYGKRLPKVKLKHLMTLTDDFGVIQFSKNTKPDKSSGYTLDDNARAIIVCSMHYDIIGKNFELDLIERYLNFIKYVQQPDGKLYTLVGYDKKINLKEWDQDAHGRALWALGYLTSVSSIPKELRDEAREIFEKALNVVNKIGSPRAMAYAISGLYFYNSARPSSKNIKKLKRLADHLVSLYEHNSSNRWRWFEEYLTYSNSKFPESLFYAYLATKYKKYLKVAESSLDFLSSITFENGMFAPIGNKGWFSKNGHKAYFDQQPVDTAYMVQTLVLANKITKKERYIKNAFTAFHWFLGKNYLNQMVYDESTGGCRDGVGEHSMNLNQGAESTISYLMARLTLAKLK